MERWEVGPEYDEELPKRLITVALQLGYTIVNGWRGHAGSQDIWHLDLRGPQGELVIEAETYMGLSLQGPADLVAEIRDAFAKAPRVEEP